MQRPWIVVMWTVVLMVNVWQMLEFLLCVYVKKDMLDQDVEMVSHIFLI